MSLRSYTPLSNPSQTNGNGTVHPASGDTWTVTYTTGGQTFTQSGTF